MLTIVTGFGPQEWESHACRMLRTLHERWPVTVELVCFVEEPVTLPKGRSVSFYQGDIGEFLHRHRGNDLTSGRQAQRVWRDKEKREGYSFRTDAFKFGRVPLAVRYAARHLVKTPIMVWLDADTVTYRDVPVGWIEREILPYGTDVAYLGREPKYPEIGFVAYRLPEAMPFLDRWADYYAQDTFTDLPEWHSAFVFHQAVKETPDVRFRDLTPGGRGHVFCQSPLAQYLDHLKGARKRDGYSREHPHAELVRRA